MLLAAGVANPTTVTGHSDLDGRLERDNRSDGHGMPCPYAGRSYFVDAGVMGEKLRLAMERAMTFSWIWIRSVSA
jgi:hypothetical protein